MGSDVIYRSLTQEDWPWLQTRARVKFGHGTKGIVVERAGQLVAAVAFSSWMPRAASAHIAIEDPWVTRRFLHELFHYFYVTCGRVTMLASVVGNNEDSIRFVTRLGFQEIARVYGAVDLETDLVVFELRKGNCRWLRPEYREAA